MKGEGEGSQGQDAHVDATDSTATLVARGLEVLFENGQDVRLGDFGQSFASKTDECDMCYCIFSGGSSSTVRHGGCVFKTLPVYFGLRGNCRLSFG